MFVVAVAVVVGQRSSAGDAYLAELVAGLGPSVPPFGAANGLDQFGRRSHWLLAVENPELDSLQLQSHILLDAEAVEAASPEDGAAEPGAFASIGGWVAAFVVAVSREVCGLS